MELCIVRHGIAQEHGTRGVVTDAERALTLQGCERTQRAALGLRAIGCAPQVVAASPLRRAEETARIMVDVLCDGDCLQVCDWLAPGACAADAAAWLRQAGAESAMIVGHMPDVADIVSGLLSGQATVDMVFKKAAACCVSFGGPPAPGEGCLEWFLQPRQLRGLASP